MRGLTYPSGAAPAGTRGSTSSSPKPARCPGGRRWLSTSGSARSTSPPSRGLSGLARSSLAKTPLMLANGVGLVDLGYRGPIKAMVWNRDRVPFRVEKGQALFQLVAADLSPSEFEVLSPSDPRASLHFSESESLRGGGGFGSTGSSGSAAPAANLHARTHLSERRSPTGIVESNRKDERLLAAFVRIQSRGAAAGLRAWCLYAWHSHTRHKKAVCWLNSRLTSRFKSWCLWCLYAWRAQVVT